MLAHTQKRFASLLLFSALALPGTSMAITPNITGRWWIDYTNSANQDFPVDISYTSTATGGCKAVYRGATTTYIGNGATVDCTVKWEDGKYKITWFGWSWGYFKGEISPDAQSMTGIYTQYYWETVGAAWTGTRLY
ncbi:MAG TPA: hypothetical protein VEU33_26655 [Archangium sp.]|nr:hypothetical protein [Archangium sp.]